MMPEFSLFTYNVIILLTVIVTKIIVGYFSKHDPWHLFSFYCRQLALKVNPDSNNVTQQRVAGFLAATITFTPIVIILWLFADFIAVPMLWQATLLYFALGGLNTFTVTSSVSKSLLANNKTQAKAILSEQVLRDVKVLSELGLTKAAIEMQLLRIAQQLITVCFFALAIGPLAAFSYRLLLEMHYNWNIKQDRFKHFGQSSHILINTLQWLPIRGFSLILLFTTIGQGFFNNLKQTFALLFKLNNDFLLSTHSLVLKASLSGVAMYEGEKLRKPAMNKTLPQPKLEQLRVSSNVLKATLWVIVTAVITLTTAFELTG